MIALLTFTPFQPTPGLAIWSALIFILFWVIIAKFAFKPIAQALEKREVDIQNALDAAKSAKEEMSNLKAENEKLIAQAREERSKIIQEAKDLRTQMINEAKDKARDEAQKIISQAKVEIDNQKKAALTEVKNYVGTLAIDIAEQVIKQKLNGQNDQETYVKSLVDKIRMN